MILHSHIVRLIKVCVCVRARFGGKIGNGNMNVIREGLGHVLPHFIGSHARKHIVQFRSTIPHVSHRTAPHGNGLIV